MEDARDTVATSSSIPLKPVNSTKSDKSGRQQHASTHSLITDKDREREEAPANDEQNTLGLMESIMFIVSIMVGSGIFSSVGTIHAKARSFGLAMIMWVMTGLIALCGALGYAELGTAIPGSGGEMQYLEKAYGSWACFTFEWATLLITRPAGVAALMKAFASHAIMAYLAAKQDQATIDIILDSKSPKADIRDHWRWVEVAITTVAIMFITMLASVAPRVANKTQSILTYSKVICLVIIIFLGFGVAIKQKFNGQAVLLAANAANPFEWIEDDALKNINPGDRLRRAKEFIFGWMTAIGLGLWSFDGWNSINAIAGRVRAPEKTLPRALTMGILLVLGLYFFVILGYYSVVEKQQILSTEVIGYFFGHALWKWYGGILMCLLVMASTFGATVSSVITIPDVIDECIKKEHIPKAFGRVNEQTGTQITALWSQAVISILVLLKFNKDFESLAILASIPSWIAYIACSIAVVMLRRREPDLARPYQVFILLPIIFVIACIILIMINVADKIVMCGLGLLVTLAALPVYYLAHAGKKRSGRPSVRPAPTAQKSGI